MNTHTFGNQNTTCPICQRSSNLKLVKMCNGLFTCNSCQEKLVVTWSGHYVRDPFSGKQVLVAQLLRRQSKPWARIIRDLGVIKRPFMYVAVGLLIMGASVFTIDSVQRQQNPINQVVEKINDRNHPPSL
ncbi:hypothetical protein [Synechocystis sp. PCC 7509]|uniref:hypothetical protein n=1 Tax=Synechocystis sp. PCC 7509 TaxID=927677 RepID=UPI0002AC6057|nr:hypothetical protein [Synechocystis sp. PCC 7509]